MEYKVKITGIDIYMEITLHDDKDIGIVSKCLQKIHEKFMKEERSKNDK